MMQSSVGGVAYSVLVLDIVVLLIWSLVWMWTKAKEQAPWTDVHTSLSSIAVSMFGLLIATWLYQSGRRS